MLIKGSVSRFKSWLSAFLMETAMRLLFVPVEFFWCRCLGSFARAKLAEMGLSGLGTSKYK